MSLRGVKEGLRALEQKFLLSNHISDSFDMKMLQENRHELVRLATCIRSPSSPPFSASIFYTSSTPFRAHHVRVRLLHLVAAPHSPRSTLNNSHTVQSVGVMSLGGKGSPFFALTTRQHLDLNQSPGAIKFNKGTEWFLASHSCVISRFVGSLSEARLPSMNFSSSARLPSFIPFVY